ncbi:DUF3008 family protein [Candidatus Dependentiae bacterium]|nr:MAG: DUF3008 family protein [Candidatus Dependentiae bacterium]
MPAVSKAQQRFMGMVHAMQKGKFHGKPSKHLTDAAESMNKTDVKHFAETKHEGLPEHMKKKSNCTSHDPNIPESFDNRQKPVVVKGRLKGFAMAAKKAGFTPGQALELLHKAAAIGDNLQGPLQALSPQLAQLNSNTDGIAKQLAQLSSLGQATGSTLGGAGLGAGIGYLATSDKKKAGSNTVLGALLGGGAGLGANALSDFLSR